MRLVSKLAILLMVGMCAVLSVDGHLTVQRELALFDNDMRADAELFGKTFGLAIGEVWRSRGEARALEVLEQANAAHTGLEVRWVQLDGPVRGPHSPHIPATELAALRRGQTVSRVLVDDAEGHLYTYVPQKFGDVEGALEIAESLRGKHEYTRTTVRRVVLVVAITVLLCTVLALLLGAWVVGRPVRALVSRTRSIAEGDLATRLELRQRDELGALAHEINAMSAGLLEGRERLARETSERLRAEGQLRHADRLATVGTLASGVAHELGTPLNVVAERAAMIEKRQVPDDQIGDNARIIREQAERMTTIIRQLLAFARRGSAQRTKLDIVAVAREVAGLLESFAAKTDVSIDLDVLCARPAEAEIDPEQIRQALTNLVMNAVQASPRRAAVAVEIDRARAAPPPESGQQEEVGDFLRVVVSDKGIGMRADELSHVFEPFFTTKDVGEGTGLGLSVTHGIVCDHGGWIEVASEPGRGSRFSMYLPEGS